MIGKVERVDLPGAGLLCLTLRGRDAPRVLALSTLPGALGVGLVEQRPRGRSATEAVSQLRQHAVGATVDQIQQSGRAIRLRLERSQTARFLVCTSRKPSGGWCLTEEDGTVIVRSGGARPIAPGEVDHLHPCDDAALIDAGKGLIERHREAQLRQIARVLDKHRKRLLKKRDAIASDLARAARADSLQEQATLILANLSKIPPKASSFEATTWDDDPRTIQIPLDPGTPPQEFAQTLFRTSKRLRRGLEIAPARLESVERQLREIDALARSLEHSPPTEIAAALDALGVGATTRSKLIHSRTRTGARRAYREFLSEDGNSILVGRSAADNDRLTLRVAKPHDLWLHARGVTGAHVVVRLSKGQSCPSGTLVDAATLAAHFSDLRGEATVDVLHTPRRFVHKRKGAAVGSVTLGREKVIALRVEQPRLARLLENEKRH